MRLSYLCQFVIFAITVLFMSVPLRLLLCPSTSTSIPQTFIGILLGSEKSELTESNFLMSGIFARRGTTKRVAEIEYSQVRESNGFSKLMNC